MSRVQNAQPKLKLHAVAEDEVQPQALARSNTRARPASSRPAVKPAAGRASARTSPRRPSKAQVTRLSLGGSEHPDQPPRKGSTKAGQLKGTRRVSSGLVKFEHRLEHAVLHHHSEEKDYDAEYSHDFIQAVIKLQRAAHRVQRGTWGGGSPRL